jgi:GGDEF domain-containing protein
VLSTTPRQPWFACPDSIGLAYARKAGITRGILFGKADAALYEAKRNGRNQVRESEPELRCEDAQYQ